MTTAVKISRSSVGAPRLVVYFRVIHAIINGILMIKQFDSLPIDPPPDSLFSYKLTFYEYLTNFLNTIYILDGNA